MKFSFATAEDEKPIKQILADSDLPYQDISSSQLRHFLIVKDGSGSTLAGVVGLELRDDQLVNKIEEYARSQNITALYLLTLTAEDFFAARKYQKTDRESAPPALQETAEFKSLCPETAVCMKKHL